MLRLLRAPVLLARPAVVAIRPTLAVPRASSLLAPRVSSSSSSSLSSSRRAAPRRAMGSYGGGGHGHGTGRVWALPTEAERSARNASDTREYWESARATLLQQQFDEAEVSDTAESSAKAASPASAIAFLQSLPEESAEERVGYVLEQCDDGIERVDFVPDNWGAMHDRIFIQGEEVIVPEMHHSLEWVMSSPMDEHSFEEAPAIKDHESEAEEGKPEAAH